MPFFTRPICLVLWVITLTSILLTIDPVRRAMQRAVQAVLPRKRPEEGR
jgi:hypothetical protein